MCLRCQIWVITFWFTQINKETIREKLFLNFLSKHHATLCTKTHMMFQVVAMIKRAKFGQ